MKNRSKGLLHHFKKRYVVLANGCWQWQGCKNENGYGKIGEKISHAKFRTELAHRASYKLFIGEIPVGFDVCHECDYPSCVNPFHLYSATHKDNMNDARKKGRLPQFKHPSIRAYNLGCRCQECKDITNAKRRELYHLKNKSNVI